MSISRSVKTVKDDLESLIAPHVVDDLCRSAGHTWRCRKLDPLTTIYLFIQQVLHGNTSCSHVRQLGHFQFGPSAYCQARQRLPVRCLLRLLEYVGRQVTTLAADADHWRGHRLRGIDGSSFSMSDRPSLSGLFGYPPQQSAGCGFPVARFVALFGLRSGALIGLVADTTKTAELPICRTMHRHLRRGDVLVGDRAYCSFAHLAILMQRGIYGVFHLHAGRKHGQVVQRRNRNDIIVEWSKPRACPSWLTEQQYARLDDRLLVRLVRYRVPRRGYRTKEVTVATTLLDTSYPADEIAELYGDRWQIETNLRHIKTTMGMEVLRCQTVAGVQRELAVFGIVYNAVRYVMTAAALAQGVPPDRISFIDVLRWIKSGCPGESLPHFVQLPVRLRSSQPRVIKRRHKSYTYMTRPRSPATESHTPI